jgi:altronate dehydratase small subunit
MNTAVHINSKDNVVTCLRSIQKGETVIVGAIHITANIDIPVYHKIAITSIPSGGRCYKYGQIIGNAINDIAAGDHVHVHNIESTRGRGDKQIERRSIS